MTAQLKSPDRHTGRRRTSGPVDAGGRSPLRPLLHRTRRPRETVADATQAPARSASIPRAHKIHVPEPGLNAGLWLFLVFVAALTVMVVAVAVLAVVDASWILVPVFCLDLAVTAIVLASIMWIMRDGERPS